MKSRFRPHRLLLPSAFLVAVSSSVASAGIFYWDTDGTTPGFGDTAGTWGSSAFWSIDPAGTASASNTTITSADTVNFGTATLGLGSTASTISIDAGGVTTNRIVFGAGQASPVALSGGGGSITLAGATPTITVDNASDSIGAVLAGSAGLFKAGTGSLILNGSSVNTFTGGLNIRRGTMALDFVNLGATNNLINSGNALTLGGGGTLSVAGNATNNSSQGFASTTLSAGLGTISLAKGASAASATLDLGVLTVNPGSITTLITGTTWSNGVTPTAEILKVSGITGKTLPASSGTANWINANAGLFYRQSASNGAARWVTVDNLGNLGPLPLNIAALTTAVGNGITSATQGYQLSSANVVLSSTTANFYGLYLNPSATGRTLTLANNGTLTINGIVGLQSSNTSSILAGTGTSNIIIGSERNLVINMDNGGGTNNGNLTISAPIADNGAGASDVTIASTMPGGTPGFVILSGANTFTGQLRVLNGTLQVAAANNASTNGTLGNSASAVILGSTGQTGTLRYTGATAASSKPFTMAADGTGSIDVSTAANTLTLSGVIDGSGNLTKAGAGTLTLSGNNSHTGTTTVSAGTLVANHNSALGTTAGATTVSSGTGLVLGNGITITGETVTISGSGNSFDGALRTATAANAEWAGAVILGDANARIGAAAATTLTVSGAIQDGVGTNLNLTGASGTGTVLLSGANTYSGTTNIIRGTLKIGATNSLPTGTVLDVDLAGATEDSSFDLNGFDQTVGALQRSGAGSGTGGSFVTNSALGIKTLTVNQAVDTTYSGVIQGNLALTKGGAGSLTLTGTNTYGGATTISGGTLQLGDGTTDGTIGGTSGVTNGGTLVFNRVGNHTAAFGITGTGAVTKTGAGTQTLTTSNGYTGATLVSGGTLALSGSGAVNSSSGITIDGGGAKLLHAGGTAISPAVALNNGTLTGNGTVNAVTVGAGTGGVISNNDGVAGAALTIGTLTFNGAANLNLFSNTTSSPLIVTGTLTTGATAATLTANNPGGWNTGSTYTILTFGNNAIAGGGDNFTKVTNNLTARQSGAWSATTSAITLAISGDAPKWTGGLSSEWSTATLGAPKNWVLQTAATATDFLNTDDVLFDDTASTFTPDISAADVSPFATTFNNSANNYTLGSSGGFGIATGTLTKGGTGTLTITNANTYTGATTINGGTLQLGDGTSGKDGTIANTSGVTNNGTLVFNRFGTSTAGYVIGGSGAVTVTGTGTQTLTGANTYGGLTTINSGATLQLGDGTLGKDGTIANTSGVTNNGTLVFNRFGSSTAGYAIGGSGAVTVSGTGTQTLTGANTYGGLTTIDSGATLQLGDGTSGKDGTIANTSGVTNNGRLVFNRFGNSTAGYAIGGSGTVTKTGAGTQTLSGLSSIAANNYGGTTTIDGGTLAFTTTNPSLTGGLTFGASAGSANTGSLDLSAASASFGGGLVVRTNSAGNNVITIGSGQTLTFTGSTVTNAISVGSATAGGMAKLQVTGGGTLTVDDSTRNIVVANTDTATNPGGASAQMDLSGLGTFNATIANLYVGRPTSVAGAAANGRPLDSLTLAGANTITASGDIAVGGTLQSFAGQATLNLGTSNTLNAARFVVGSSRTNGTMQFNTGLTNPSVTLRGAAGGSARTDIYLGDAQNAQGVSNGSNGSTNTRGTMDFTGGSVNAMINELIVGNGAFGTGGNRGSGNGTFIIDGASSNVDVNTLVLARTRNDGGAQASAATPQSSILTLKSGTLVVNTEATLANDIDASNTNNGNQNVIANLNIEGGTATIGSIVTPVNLTLGNKIASGNAGTATAAVNLTGGTLNMFGNIQEGTQGNGTITSSLTLDGATLDMKGNNIGASGATVDTLTFASGTLRNVGQINNGAAITKSGGGILTLAGASTYTGATLVSAGTLFVSGSITSNITVSDNATLAGGGTTGAITLGGGSFFDVALALSGDSLDSTGGSISFAETGFGIDNLVSNGAAVNWGTVSDGTYTLISGTLDPTNLGNFGAANAFDLGGGRSAYFQSGNLELVIIPEPSAVLLGALGALLLLRRRR